MSKSNITPNKKKVSLPFLCPNCKSPTMEKRDPGTGQVYLRCLGTCRRAFSIKRV